MNDTDLHLAIERLYLELEMVDLYEQAKLFEWRCPSRSKEVMARDLCNIWKTQGIHEQAVDGHWRNGMANNLNGSEDRFIDRCARVFWDENDMAKRRDQVIKDTTDEWKKGRLPWCYKTVRAMIAPFPKTGHMDTYRAGQSDEGEADCEKVMAAGAFWDDGIASDEDLRACGACSRKRSGEDLRASGAGSRKRPAGDLHVGEAEAIVPYDKRPPPVDEFAIVPYDPHPTPTAEEAIAQVASELASKVTRCEALLASARTLGSWPLQKAAQRELLRLKKKASGPWRERATVTVGMCHPEDRAAFDQDRTRMRVLKLKDEEDRLKTVAARLKKREAKLGRARAKVKAALSESGGDSSAAVPVD